MSTLQALHTWIETHQDIYHLTALLALAWLTWRWVLERRAVRARIAANNAGAYCPHGRFTWHRAYCDGCKAAAAREFAQVEVKPEVKKETSKIVHTTGGGYVSSEAIEPVNYLPTMMGGALSAAAGLFGGPLAGAAIASALAGAARYKAVKLDLAMRGPTQQILAGCQQTVVFHESMLYHGSVIEKYIFDFSDPDALRCCERVRIYARGELISDEKPCAELGQRKLVAPLPFMNGVMWRVDLEFSSAVKAGTVTVSWTRRPEVYQR